MRRLPPHAAWALWRAGLWVAASARRSPAPGTEVRLAHVAWSVSADELGALIERLLESTGTPPSEVLVVSDCDAVHVAAAAGCRLEYVPTSADWQRTFPGRDYQVFLAARGRAIADAFQIARVEIPGDAPEALRRALATGS